MCSPVGQRGEERRLAEMFEKCFHSRVDIGNLFGRFGLKMFTSLLHVNSSTLHGVMMLCCKRENSEMDPTFDFCPEEDGRLSRGLDSFPGASEEFESGVMTDGRR